MEKKKLEKRQQQPSAWSSINHSHLFSRFTIFFHWTTALFNQKPMIVQ